MCGIAGVYIKDPTVIKSHPGFERFMNELHLGIEGRGKHASGFVAVDRNGKVTMDKADIAASEFILNREPMPQEPWYVLLHTRYATKGDVKNYLNNHPVIHGSCFTTHNGSIENDDELFEKYGFSRYGEVDTEILPALVGTTNFDPVKIRETFKEIKGACAMATIDPVNHPGKVLLLRTNHHSPLYLIDTQKYTIWASTQESIKQAWGKVLGTPPEAQKFKYVPAWRFMILHGQDNPGAFELEEPPVVHYAGNYTGATVRDPITNQWISPAELKKREEIREKLKKTEKKEEKEQDDTVPASLITNEEVRKRVRALREKGLGRATTWNLDGRNGVGRAFLHCSICRDMVCTEDHTDTLNRGRMCLDCAEMFNLIYSERMTITEDLDKDLSDDLCEKLNKWGVDEEQVHHETMEFLASSTKLEIPVLEYIMFRGYVGELKAGPPALEKLSTELWHIYHDQYTSLWEEVDEAGTDAFTNIVKAGKAQGRGTSTKGVTHSRQKTTSKMPSIGHFSNKNANKRNHKCLFCRKRPKIRLVMADREAADFNYCNQHNLKCNINGCSGAANHTLKSGSRVCHEHARGKKECYADTQLAEMGYTWEAV